MGKIITVIVTYNAMQWIDKCIPSLLKSNTKTDILVYDNCSTDETVEYIKMRFPEVILMGGDKNLGFAQSNNIGMRYALDNGYDYIFLLNQDAWIEDDTITELLRTFKDNERVGIASPIHLTGDGKSLDFYFAYNAPIEFIQNLYSRNLSKYYKVNGSGAAAWMLSSTILETVGGFDTNVFVHYGEDENYCQRVLYHDFTIVVNTDCNIFHDRVNPNENSRMGLDIWKSKNSFFDEKAHWSNILWDVNINAIALKTRLTMIKNLLRFDFQDYRLQKRRLAVLKAVNRSRTINKSIGRHWL